MNLNPRNGGSRAWEVEAFILRKPDLILGATVLCSAWENSVAVHESESRNGGIRVKEIEACCVTVCSKMIGERERDEWDCIYKMDHLGQRLQEVREVFRLLRGFHSTYEIRFAPMIPASLEFRV